MSQVNIEIIDAEYADVPKKNGKGTYGKLTVTHKTEEGKVEAKSIFDFATPKEVFQKLRQANKGDCFAITREKDDNGFWTWTEADTQTAMVKSTPATPPVRPSYETPDERAKRQVFIIRQSSISSAVELLKGKEATPEMVIAVARKFENYVMANGIEDLESDVPY